MLAAQQKLNKTAWMEFQLALDRTLEELKSLLSHKLQKEAAVLLFSMKEFKDKYQYALIGCTLKLPTTQNNNWKAIQAMATLHPIVTATHLSTTWTFASAQAHGWNLKVVVTAIVTQPKMGGSLNRNCIADVPDPFFPPPYKKAVWLCETNSKLSH